MRNGLFLSMLLFGTGCVAPAGDRRIEVPPPPVDVGNLDYLDVLSRARLQATGATEAFYLDNWAALEDAARSLEQTSRLLSRSENLPEAKRGQIEGEATELAGFARELGDAARQRDVDTSTARLQSIGLKIRQLQIGH